MSTAFFGQQTGSQPRSAEDQLALEQEMVSLGGDRVDLFTNRQRKNRTQSLSKWGEHLTAFGVEQIMGHLRTVRRRIKAGKAGQNFALLLPVTLLPPQVVAAAAVRTVIDSISCNDTLHYVAMDVAEKLWIETMLRRATKQELYRYRRVRSIKRQRLASILRMQNTEIWEAKQRMASGVFLVELIARESGMIEIVLDRSFKPARRVVKATEQCMQWISDVTQQQRLMTPNWLPMLVQPRPWSTPLSGGYLNEQLPVSLFKSGSDVVAAHCDGSEPFMAAANLHQTVGWKVNGWMLDQVSHAYDNSLEVGCLLPREGWPVPPYPKHLNDDDDGVVRWRNKARRIHEKNDKTRNARIAQAKCLWVARRFASEQAIYFPMSLDFRGRYYYRPPYLNPQGNDVSRSLLLFAEGTPISCEQDADWLRVHGANVYGLGKQDFRSRIDWVHENQLQIEATGRDPWQHAEFWMRADKPWQFLAFCRAYQQFSSQGYGYVCDLPVMLDCTCSGIQHYSALLRSSQMGALVNLTDNDSGPADIYRTVIERVLTILRGSDDQMAADWLQLQPDRSLAKPCVMTLPYSATRSAFYFYAYNWALERSEELFNNKTWVNLPGATKTVHYMARILHEQATSLVQPAAEAMEWFRSVGRVAGKAGVPLRWRSPSGLLVHQSYPNTRMKRIRLNYLSDVRLDIRCQVDDIGLDSRRMGNALSPNVVHSLDSSHMTLTTIHAMTHGVRNLGGIHDCFATTPAEMTQLRNSVRETFAQIYCDDLFDRIASELLSQIPSDLLPSIPTRPTLGRLDLAQVQQSDYFIT